MFPQLNATTFPSQIFWVILGFFCVYVIMAFFAVPRLRKILGDRQSYVDNLLDVAKKFNEKSEKLGKESRNLLAETKQIIYRDEARLIEELNKKNAEINRKISQSVLEQRNREIASLSDSSEEVFKEVSADLDELVNLAMQKVEGQKL